MFLKIIILVFIVLLSPLYSVANFNSNNITVDGLIHKIQGKGLTISNARIKRGVVGGRKSQFATFSNGISGAHLQIDEGILMSTGFASTGFTQNTSGRTSQNPVDNGGSQDPDLRAIARFPIFNQAILEFDIVLDPGTYLLEIDYQFASEEYPEWVGTKFNDAFGFFISGGDLPQKYNIARANNSPTTINISNISNYDTVIVNAINNGKRGNMSSYNIPTILTHADLFIDNGGTDVGKGGIDTSKRKIVSEYDGFTTKLYANMDNLTPGIIYHFKMAIADTSDANWDMGVFINKIRAYSGAKFSINGYDATATEGNDLKFTITLDRPAVNPITIHLSTENIEAIKGADFTDPQPMSVTFNPGETSKVIKVPTLIDNIQEDPETMKLIGTVDEADKQYILNTTESGKGTILDGVLPSLNINSIQKNEGNNNTTSFNFNVTLNMPSTHDVSVNYITSDGTATIADSDYIAKSGTIHFVAGETSKTVTILVNGDTKLEENETFNVTLSSPTNALIMGSTGIGTILNDDTLPTLSINDIQKNEGNSSTTDFDFTVSLSKSYPIDVTVDYLTTDDTATTADSDYQALTSQTLTIPAGQTTATITAKVNGDTIVESDETFNIILSNPSNASISDDTGVGTILNDDSYPGITINDIQLNEGNSGTINFTFTVSLDNAHTSAVSVNYATSNGTATTADSDYSAKFGTVNFAAGETSKTVTILINGDTKVEPNETFNVTLSNPSNVTISDGTGVGTILNDDAEPTLSINNVEKEEGDSGITTFDFTVSLSKTYPVDVTVVYNTANGTATTADSDYNAASGSLTIAAGTTTASVNIAVNGDTKIEEDETFTVTLSNPQNATLGSAVGTGTILNDDFANLSVGDVSILEGDSGTKNLTLTLNLSKAFYNDVTLSYATQDGTATIADNDYVEVNATQVTFAPNETSKEINITINGDLNIEDDETFYLLLSNPSNVNISDTNLTGTILNDDNATLSINDVNLSEGNTGYTDFNFTVSMSLPHREVVTVKYATSDGTAELADNDYNQTLGTLTFAAGETEKTVTVKVVGDFFIEPDETFTVTLSDVSANAYISTTDGTGTGTILNDDSGTQTSQMTFNVERTNSADTGSIGSAERNAWYTQISGRPFDYDVVSYDKDIANEYPLSNVVVKVSLRSINGIDNEQIGTEQYVYFSNEKTRATYSGLKVDGAYKDAKFKIFVPTNGGGIILKTDCSGFGTDYKACYDKLEQDTKNRDSSGFSDIAVDAKDDFAIRPAGLKYGVSINTGEDLVDNTPPKSQDKAFAAGVNYNMHIQGVKYDDTATDITTYSTSTIIWGLAFDDASGTTCNDKEDYNGTLPVNSGSADTSTFTHSQVGIYTLSALDEEWTKVDKDKGDCDVGKSDVSPETDGTTKSGCNIGSEVTFNDNTYKNDTLTFNPDHFDVNVSASTKPEDLELVYMHTIEGTDSNMSAQIDANVTALSKTGTKLSNFTKECMAQDVQYTMNISSDPEVLQDTLSGDHSIYVNVDDATYQIENNVSSELTLAKDKFAKDENGTAPITLNYNIDRLDNASMNPVTVTFNALNVSSKDAKYNTSISATTMPTGSSTETETEVFVYARVRASQKLYVGDRNFNDGIISTPLAMDIYCEDEVARPNLCIDSNGTGVYGIRTSLTGDNWWLATASATSNEQGTVKLDNNDNKIKVPNAITDISDKTDRSNAINLSVTVNCPDTNKITEVKLEDGTSPWIVFDNDPLYSIRCSGSGDWAGTGKLGSVVGGATDNGATLDEDGNRNNDRAPANQSTKTHRLSW